ncbi:Hypothetical protein SMAX5B_019164 [Scophthalmus maximus]|uniref:Uncharacterized protein n=1 Tax=Scophthalmus maximus TaxID=52904 RepID=A0A2U9C4Z0_SCOMX|nr:Hypothetical protein SMAX5B_019164 [Scophthalmus maximus]
MSCLTLKGGNGIKGERHGEKTNERLGFSGDRRCGGSGVRPSGRSVASAAPSPLLSNAAATLVVGRTSGG